MCFEDRDQPFVLGTVLLDALEFVPCGSKSAARSMTQRCDRSGTFLIRVNHVFCQSANDAVVAGVNVGDPVFVFSGGLDHGTCCGIDDRGNTARLGIERIHFRHQVLFLVIGLNRGEA